MKKIITIVIAIASIMAFANTPQQRVSATKELMQDCEMRYNNARTNSVSKIEIENAEKDFDAAKKAYEDAKEELELLTEWNLQDFTDSDCAFMAWDRYSRGKSMVISKFCTSADEAANVAIARGVMATQDTKKKCAMAVQILEDK